MDADKRSVENEFFTWLSMRVSPVQLSNIYTAYDGINSFCLKRKILRWNLFETTDEDTIVKVKKIIDQDQTFSFTYKKQRKLMAQAIQYYLLFIQKMHPVVDVIKDEKTRLFKSTAVTTESDNDALKALLRKEGVPFIDNRAKNGCLWILNGIGRKEFVKRCKSMGVTFHFKAEGSSATDGRSAWWTKDSLKPDNRSNSGSKNNDTPINESNPSDSHSNRVRYLSWLKKRDCSVGIAISYLSALKKSGERAVELGILNRDVFSVVSLEEFKAVRKGLLADSTFVNWNLKNSNTFSSAVDSYALYLRDIPDIETTKLEVVKPILKNDSALANQVEAKPRSVSSDADLKEILKDELFTPLLQELMRQGITTVQELRDIKLWPFMNRYNLYSIAMRQLVLEKVQKRLELMNPSDSSEQVVLICGEKKYKAGTISKAYLLFCEEVARKYPLKFRSLIGRDITPGGLVPVSRTEKEGRSLKMTNPLAYIDNDMSVQEVTEKASWLCRMCMGDVPLISVVESIKEPPLGEAKPVQPAPALLDTPVKAVPAVEPENKQDCSTEPKLSKYDQYMINRMEQIVFDVDLNGIGIDEVKEKMSITMAAARRFARLARYLVEIKGRLYHEAAFVDWDDGAEKLDTILDKLIQKNNGYVSAAQLYKYARFDMPMFLNDNDMDDERSVYEIAQHLFEKVHYHGKSYIFTGKMHISSKKADIVSNFDIYCKYAEDQGGIFAFNDLIDYLTGIGIRIGNLRGQLKLYSEPEFFYYEPGILIYSKSMNIDAEWKNTVKDAFSRLTKEYE